MKVDKDFEYCRKIMKDQSKTFYLAFGFLPSPKKEAVWAYYAYNRFLDDIGDDQKDVDRLRLEEMRFLDLCNGKVADDPIYRALSAVMVKFPVNKEAILSMFRGQYKDASETKIRTEEELLEYCYDVAGSVGDMLLPILATHNHERLHESAAWIGKAMQLTNILRDVGEDYRNGRCYLPEDKLHEASVDLEKLVGRVQGSRDDLKNYLKVWNHYAEMAKDFYEKGLNELDLYDKESRFILVLAARLYGGILNKAKKTGYGLYQRAHLSYAEKIFLLLVLKLKGEDSWKISG